MSAIELVGSEVPVARLAAIRVVGPASLEVRWAEGTRNGESETVDLTPALGSYKVYRPLRNNPALFATACLVEDGYAVAWDGPDLEMAGETIESLARESMTPAEFAAFLARNNLTQDAAAAVLGRSRRQICYYLNPGPVPRVVALACIGYEALKRRKAIEAA
jgi:hypothetical protein